MNHIRNNYQEYLNSYAWKAIKKTKLEENPYCEICWDKSVTVHHLSYKRLWKENESDLASLCKDCHNECHFVEWYQIKNDEKELRRRFEELWKLGINKILLSIDQEFSYKLESIRNSEEEASLIEYERRESFEYEQTEPLEDYYKRKNDEERRSSICNLELESKLSYLYFLKSNDKSIETSSILLKKLIYRYYSWQTTENDNLSIFKKHIVNKEVYGRFIEIINFLKEKSSIIKSQPKYSIICHYTHISTLNEVDFDTFEEIEDIYARDKNNIYSWDYSVYDISWFIAHIYRHLNAASFTVLNSWYCKDRNWVYLSDDWISELKKIKWCDKESFEVLNDTYSKDKDSIYSNWEKIDWIDIGSFKTLSRGYCKDKNYIYYDWKRMEWINVNNFKVPDPEMLF